jgi:hypothetical protein
MSGCLTDIKQVIVGPHCASVFHRDNAVRTRLAQQEPPPCQYGSGGRTVARMAIADPRPADLRALKGKTHRPKKQAARVQPLMTTVCPDDRSTASTIWAQAQPPWEHRANGERCSTKARCAPHGSPSHSTYSPRHLPHADGPALPRETWANRKNTDRGWSWMMMVVGGRGGAHVQHIDPCTPHLVRMNRL